MNIKNNIRHYRNKFKVTQEELASKMKMQKNSISRLELNKHLPGIEVIFQLIKAFEEITRLKSNGKMIVRLKLDDLYYDDDAGEKKESLNW